MTGVSPMAIAPVISVNNVTYFNNYVTFMKGSAGKFALPGNFIFKGVFLLQT